MRAHVCVHTRVHAYTAQVDANVRALSPWIWSLLVAAAPVATLCATPENGAKRRRVHETPRFGEQEPAGNELGQCV